MLKFLAFIFKILFNLIRSQKSLLVKLTILEKEVEILNRQRKKRIQFTFSDRVSFSLLNIVGSIKGNLSIVRPETVLKWQRNLIKKFWTLERKKKPGRPPVEQKIKNLILRIKNENLIWGVRKIQGELLKLHIELDYKTIWNILREFRRQGKIQKSLSWKKFLKMQARSIYAMDFFTVDTLLNKRYYVHFIIHHASRRIVQFAITENPVREFVKQQMIDFEEEVDVTVFMIRDRAPEFFLDYSN